MKLPPFPYGNNPSTLVKLQARVSDTDKDLLMTVIPDRNLFTLFLQHALKRTADFIRANDLDFNHPGDQQRLLDYITAPYSVRGSTAVGVDGQAIPRDVDGRAAKIRTALAHVQDKSSHTGEGAGRRSKETQGRRKVVKDAND